MRLDGDRVRPVLLTLAVAVVAAIGIGTQLTKGVPAQTPSSAGAGSSDVQVPGATMAPGTPGTGSTPAPVPTPASTGSSAAGASASASAPRPFVHDFAQGGTPNAPLPSPTAPIPFNWFRIDCDFAYGVAGQCVSWSRMTEQERAEEDWCGYLARIGWTAGVTVQEISADPKNLDRNGDGVGCGAGDLD